MIRIGRKYSVEEVLAKVPFKATRKDKAIAEFDGDTIKMNSFRYSLFLHKGCTCVTCGLEGTYFYKERQEASVGYHFNLYGLDKDGNEELMTKDHIHPKSKGGRDHLDNFQPMCQKCNIEKGAKL
mgnify:CR=1 FL=1